MTEPDLKPSSPTPKGPQVVLTECEPPAANSTSPSTSLVSSTASSQPQLLTPEYQSFCFNSVGSPQAITNNTSLMEHPHVNESPCRRREGDVMMTRETKWDALWEFEDVAEDQEKMLLRDKIMFLENKVIAQDNMFIAQEKKALAMQQMLMQKVKHLTAVNTRNQTLFLNIQESLGRINPPNVGCGDQ